MHEPDDLMDRLRAARPEPDAELTSPTGAPALALRQEILDMQTTSTDTDAPAPVGRRRRLALSVTGIAAAGLAVTLVVTNGNDGTGTSPGRRDDVATATTDAPAPVVDVQLIAARSNEALGRSGRATVFFHTDIDGAQYVSSAGRSDIAFSGEDIEMTITFDGSDETIPERGGFVAQNKTVDGQFFLLDGPPGAKTWTRDTNETGGRGSEIFTIDPRKLFSLLSSDGTLEPVGEEDMDGVPVRHYRQGEWQLIGNLDAFGLGNLGLGPTGDVKVTGLDLWVGDDGVTRGIDLAITQQREVVDATKAPSIEKRSDGKIVYRNADGSVVEGSPEDIDAMLPKILEDVRSTYSVRFTDIGAPITIEPPAEYTDVAGVG